MPRAGGLRPQRRTDHLDTVRTSQQARHGHKDMRHQAGPAAGTTRAKITNIADRSRPRMTPRHQAAPARANQLPNPKTALDLDNVATHHDHGCLRCTSPDSLTAR